jgi:NTE family protein
MSIPIRDTLIPDAAKSTPAPSFGIALGGGGARGFAHIPILEALDELGIIPSVIGGTSIGSMIGAAYASGMSGAEVRAYCEELFFRRTALVRRLIANWNTRNPLFRGNGSNSLFPGENVLKALLPPSLPETFEGLRIPLLAVTTDFYTQSQYVVESGPLVPAIVASSSLPGVLRPIELDDRVLIDGGFVNPVPFDLVQQRADIVAAIDITAGAQQSKGKLPSLIEAIIGANQITLRSVLQEKLKASAPDILIRPEIGHYKVLDFYKIKEILAAAEPAKEEFKRACEEAFARAERAQSAPSTGT